MKSAVPSFPEIGRAPAIKSVMRHGCNRTWCFFVGLCREGDVVYDGLSPLPRRAAQGKLDRSLVSSQSRFSWAAARKCYVLRCLQMRGTF